MLHLGGMAMQNQTYRESVREWAQDMERASSELRSQLAGTIEEENFLRWEESFKQVAAAADDFEIAEEELYELSAEVHEGFTLLIQDSFPDEERQMGETGVPQGGHRLPLLPYAYDALEPYISGEIMYLHHDKHHQSYVDGLNKAEKELKKARDTGDFGLVKHWQREAAFHGSGHNLHTIFWSTMSPHGGGRPGIELEKRINDDFGSFDQFKKHFSAAAKAVEGSGWAILAWSPRYHRLVLLTAENHQNQVQQDTVPLLPLDVWEHAYYLQYKNDRGKYVDNWWNVVHWPEVERRYHQAKKLKWEPY